MIDSDTETNLKVAYNEDSLSALRQPCGNLTISLARLRAWPKAVPVVTTLLARPQSKASFGSKSLPVRIKSRARDKPIKAGNLYSKTKYGLVDELIFYLTVAPSMRGTPNRLLRNPSLLFSSTTLISHMMASSNPPATQ